jgi:hypothetical protein
MPSFDEPDTVREMRDRFGLDQITESLIYHNESVWTSPGGNWFLCVGETLLCVVDSIPARDHNKFVQAFPQFSTKWISS